MMSPASSAADDEETQIDYEKEMAMASVRGGRGKALPWTSMDTILDYEEVDVVPKHYSQLQKQYLQIESLRNLNHAESLHSVTRTYRCSVIESCVYKCRWIFSAPDFDEDGVKFRTVEIEEQNGHTCSKGGLQLDEDDQLSGDDL
jgi:hypothetical protein